MSQDLTYFVIAKALCSKFESEIVCIFFFLLTICFNIKSQKMSFIESKFFRSIKSIFWIFRSIFFAFRSIKTCPICKQVKK